MKRIKEGNNLGEVTDLVFDATEGKSFTTMGGLDKALKSVGLKVVEVIPSEYAVVEYKGESYLVFVTEKKPFEVISVENDVEGLTFGD